jgi:hypothetical protein
MILETPWSIFGAMAHGRSGRRYWHRRHVSPVPTSGFMAFASATVTIRAVG